MCTDRKIWQPCHSCVFSKERNDVHNSFWHLLCTEGLFFRCESKPEKLLICFLCPYWKFLQCKPANAEHIWGGVGGGQDLSLCCAIFQRSKRDRNFFFLQKVVSISILCGCFLFKYSYFLYLHDFAGKHLSTLILSRVVTFLAWLIFGSKTASGFNLQGLYYEKRMSSKCLPSPYNPTPGHACIQCVLWYPKERLLLCF